MEKREGLTMKLTALTLALVSSAAYVSARPADSTLNSMAKAYALHDKTRAAFATNLTTTLANMPPSMNAALMTEFAAAMPGNPYCTEVEASWCRGSSPPAWCDLCGDLGKRSLDVIKITSVTDLDTALANLPPSMSAGLMTDFARVTASGNPRCTDVEAGWCRGNHPPAWCSMCDLTKSNDHPILAAAAAPIHLLPRHHPDGRCHVKEIKKCEKKIEQK
ncbi:hypothetical protein E4T38_09754 [Aureobasidium subglaciale]|nr:hypothetical protein E4T38_09754 [Aureobasidium subglaciale]KAI5213452.1 hypothetical protein E4T40_09716 [Aureobasidium subglaciale]KAI5214992.1 hypothetical protein E4T41_09746 [Aureobasidium subglaciale]KAI5253167.1 hypothetical protein E4T46_09721 [Aureobasidium subglaciale]